jgi:hypothetical protein
VYVLDTLVRPGVLQPLWVLSHYVPVVTLRVDLRYADSRRAAVEHPDVIALFPELHDSVLHCPLPYQGCHSEQPAEEPQEQPPTESEEPDLEAGATQGAIAGTQELPREESAEHDFDVAERWGSGDGSVAEGMEDVGMGGLCCDEELAPWGYLVEVAGRRACLSQLGVADLCRAVQAGSTTFTLIRGDAVAPHGWLHGGALASVAALLPAAALQAAPVSVRQGVEVDVLWQLLTSGRPEALTPVDWSAAVTLFLCRVLLGPQCTLHFGLTDATGLFEYHYGTWERCAAAVARGKPWGVMLDYTDNTTRHCVPVYLFTNSAAVAVL